VVCGVWVIGYADMALHRDFEVTFQVKQQALIIYPRRFLRNLGTGDKVPLV